MCVRLEKWLDNQCIFHRNWILQQIRHLHIWLNSAGQPEVKWKYIQRLQDQADSFIDPTSLEVSWGITGALWNNGNDVLALTPYLNLRATSDKGTVTTLYKIDWLILTACQLIYN